MAKPLHLVIISERTRSHFHLPLARFRQLRITHLSRHVFDDMSPSDQQGVVRFGSVFDLWRKLKALQPDLIQGLEPYYGFSRFKIPFKVVPLLCVIRWYVQLTRTPFFFHVLENLPPQQKYGRVAGFIMQRFGRWYASAAAFILYANTAAQQNVAAWQLHIPAERSLWGLWGADERVFRYQPNQKSPEPLFVFAGTLSYQKGVLDVLEAFRQLAAGQSTVRLQIIGTGPLQSMVEDRIREYGLNSRVALLGSLPHTKMAAHLVQAWALLAPSRTVGYVAEQVGLLNIESLLCGTPVIVSDAGSAHEFVAASGGAIVIREGDMSALVAAMQLLLQDSSRRTALSRAAAAYGMSQYAYAQTLPIIERQVLRLASAVSVSQE